MIDPYRLITTDTTAATATITITIINTIPSLLRNAFPILPITGGTRAGRDEVNQAQRGSCIPGEQPPWAQPEKLGVGLICIRVLQLKMALRSSNHVNLTRTYTRPTLNP